MSLTHPIRHSRAKDMKLFQKNPELKCMDLTAQHVCVTRRNISSRIPFYEHHALLLDRDGESVIHFQQHLDLGKSFVQQESWADFMQHSREEDVSFISHEQDTKFTPKQVIERAKSQEGEHEFSTTERNCEHFVNWCWRDEAISKQVQYRGFFLSLFGAACTLLGLSLVKSSTSSRF